MQAVVRGFAVHVVLSLLTASCSGGASGVDGALESLRDRQDAADRRLAATLQEVSLAEQRAREAEKAANLAECRARSLQFEAAASEVAASCAQRQAAVDLCRAEVAKSAADSTILGCVAGIVVAAATGGAAGPVAMAGCGAGRILAPDEEPCGEATCESAGDPVWQLVLEANAIESLPMCGGQVGASLRSAPRVGLTINSVVRGTTGERLHLQTGDVLMSLQSSRVGSREDLHSALEKIGDGEPLEATVSRDGRQLLRKALHSGHILGVELGEPVEVPEAAVLLGEIEKGSAADVAGLRAGDELVAIDGSLIRSIEGAKRMVRTAPEGTVLEVEYRRRGRTRRVSVALASRQTPDAF